MVLYLSAIDKKGETRNFSCQLSEFEAAFNILNSIVANGDTLLSANILDADNSTALPLEAFDGVPFLDVFRDLESEWKSALGASELQFSPINRQEMVNWTRQRVNWYESRITSLELTISRVGLLLDRTKEAQTRLVDHYKSLINSYNRMLLKTRFMHKLALDRLSRLEE
jgi:hypothetical protein